MNKKVCFHAPFVRNMKGMTWLLYDPILDKCKLFYHTLKSCGTASCGTRSRQREKTSTIFCVDWHALAHHHYAYTACWDRVQLLCMWAKLKRGEEGLHLCIWKFFIFDPQLGTAFKICPTWHVSIYYSSSTIIYLDRLFGSHLVVQKNNQMQVCPVKKFHRWKSEKFENLNLLV
jgi:hypothetical protein